LVISAHWEEKVPTVMTSPNPPMFYDYYGFPPDSYTIQWPAPGDPILAGRVEELLAQAGFDTKENPERGFDHGTFVPFKLSWPKADIPTVQLSLIHNLDPAQHIALGKALAPLRDEGVLILGSGMSYHNLREYFKGTGKEVSEKFDGWLKEAVTAAPKTRDELLTHWVQAPAARQVHPREEHLLPLMVVAGAAGSDKGKITFNDYFMGTKISAVEFRN
jgi:aromatic ring-opening dioxygenase catalytic subunit (LigB family)